MRNRPAGLVEVAEPVGRRAPVLESESLALDQVMGAVLVEAVVSRRPGQVDVRAQVVRHSPSRCSSSRRRRPTRRRRPRSEALLARNDANLASLPPAWADEDLAMPA